MVVLHNNYLEDKVRFVLILVSFAMTICFRLPPILAISQMIIALSFASSSFIEEEHQTRYFLLVSGLIYFAFQRFRISMSAAVALLFVAVIHRFVRTINQTGDKWAHLPDLSDSING